MSRWAVAAVCLVVVAGVACRANTTPPDRQSQTTEPSPGESTIRPSPVLESPTPYEPRAGEVYPNAKRLAGRFVQALASFDPASGWEKHIESVVADFDVTKPVSLAKAMDTLGDSEAPSVGRIVYAQLGGLQPDEIQPTSTSVMVVVEQLWTDGSSRTVALDVRLRIKNDQWAVSGIGSAGGPPTSRPAALPDAAKAVLDNPRIDLPDSARWDIYRGEISADLLAIMDRLAERFNYSVTVLKSGHPKRVFGTRFVSNHTMGRAVDIWAVGKVPVVRQVADLESLARRFARLALDEPLVNELGSPWDLGKDSFSNIVHQDHIHIAFDE